VSPGGSAASAAEESEAVTRAHERSRSRHIASAYAPGVTPTMRSEDRCGALGSQRSTKITRALVLSEPASIDAGEITDKGYLDQRALLHRRAADVTRLFEGDADVLHA
jgi:hypothetical protein